MTYPAQLMVRNDGVVEGQLQWSGGELVSFPKAVLQVLIPLSNRPMLCERPILIKSFNHHPDIVPQKLLPAFRQAVLLSG